MSKWLFDKEEKLREIVLVGTKPHSELKSIVVSEITINEIPKDILQDRDCLIFTSRYAISALAKSAQNYQELSKWVSMPSYVIGGSSAKRLKECNANVVFIGSDAHGANFAQELVEKLQDKHPLYLRAERIVSHLNEKLLEAKIDLKECIAYSNQPKNLDSSLKPASNSVLIFTAPSAYQSFKQNFGWDGNYVAVAIGMTTFSAFDSDVMGFVSQIQSIDGCITLAKDLAQSLP